MGVILLFLAIQAHLILENRRQKYFRYCKIGKKIYIMFDKMRHQQTTLSESFIYRGRGAK